jgi:hypothetical protein
LQAETLFVLLEAFMAPLRIFGCLIALELCFSQILVFRLPSISLIRCGSGVVAVCVTLFLSQSLSFLLQKLKKFKLDLKV